MWFWISMGLLFISLTACQAGQRTITLSDEQEASLNTLATSRNTPMDAVLAVVVQQGILVEQQRQRQADELTLLEAFRKLAPADQAVVLESPDLKKEGKIK